MDLPTTSYCLQSTWAHAYFPITLIFAFPNREPKAVDKTMVTYKGKVKYIHASSYI